MATTRLCNGCLKPIPADAPQGLCPECLVKVGLGSEPAAKSGGDGFAPPDPKELAPLFPQLEVIELLGQGGMGVVYKARQPQLDRLVALKILPPASGRDPAFAERFTREARALARLGHPNIVAIHDFGRAGDYFYLVMEFVDGVNLRQLEQSRQLTPQEALVIIPKICEALQYAHEEGIVHRDIKPGNILIDKRGRVKIADFGLAKLLGKEATDARLTQSQHVMGTPHYMAPEQVENPQSVDHRADIYSLGVVFYEMLTGELPIGRFASPSSRMRGIEVDVRIDEVVLKSLEKEPERRYQQASEVKTDVETIAGSGQPHVTPSASVVAPVRTGLTAVVERQIRNAAIAVSVSAALNLAAVMFIVVLLSIFHPEELSQRSNAVAGGCLLAVLAYGFIVFCARGMKRLESHRFALAGSILLMVMTLGDVLGYLSGWWTEMKLLTPGNLLGLGIGKRIILPGHLIGIPAAIWAIAVLVRPGVRAAFEREGIESSRPDLIATAAGRASRVTGARSSAEGIPATRRPIWVWGIIAALAVSITVLSGLIIPRWALFSKGQSILIRELSRATGSSPGAREFHYYIETPANHRVSFWIDCWRNGQPAPIHGLDLAESFIPAQGESFTATAELEFFDHRPGTNTTSWVWRLKSSNGDVSREGRMSDPFLGMNLRDSTEGRLQQWKPKAGETITLLTLRGAYKEMPGDPVTNPAGARTADRVIELNMRIDPVEPDEVTTAVQAGAPLPVEIQSAKRLVEKGIYIREQKHVSNTTWNGRFYTYDLSTPANHRVSFWLECWRKGQRVTLPDFDFADSVTPARGKPVTGFVGLAMWESPDSGGANKTTWTWGVNLDAGLFSKNGMLDNPFADMTHRDSTWGSVSTWNPQPGEEVTLLMIRGDKERLSSEEFDGRTNADPIDLLIKLKARVDAVPESEMQEAPQSSSIIPPVNPR